MSGQSSNSLQLFAQRDNPERRFTFAFRVGVCQNAFEFKT